MYRFQNSNLSGVEFGKEEGVKMLLNSGYVVKRIKWTGRVSTMLALYRIKESAYNFKYEGRPNTT